MMAFEYLSIQRVFETKKLSTKNGTPKPKQYTIIRTSALLGSVALIAKIAPMIGPLQGVHPAAKAIPIKIDPINPDGLFLNENFLSFIKKSNFSTPVMIRPKTMISIATLYLNRYPYFKITL